MRNKNVVFHSLGLSVIAGAVLLMTYAVIVLASGFSLTLFENIKVIIYSEVIMMIFACFYILSLFREFLKRILQ
jgi:hypothetical protein